MTDESFRLTPLDIRRYDFGNALRGYDRTRVDQFRDQVAEEFEKLMRQNQELAWTARGFHEQLRAFRERDKALNDALVSAQQLRAEIREQAEREAQLLMREARAEVERGVADLRSEAKKVEEDIAALVRARRAYLSQLRTLVERQLSEIGAAEAAPGPTLPSTTRAEEQPPAPRQSHPTPAWLDSLVKE